VNAVTEDDRRDAAYTVVLRRVLWGEEKPGILESLRDKGFSENEAESIFNEAHQERIVSIRAIYWKRIVWGLSFIGLGVGLVSGTWFLTEGYTVWSGRAVVLPAAPVAYGAWKFLNGLIGVCTAGSRSGPVADID
jgi:hypothetical protein